MAQTVKTTTDKGDQLEWLNPNEEGQTTLVVYPLTPDGEPTPTPVRIELSDLDVAALIGTAQALGY